MTAIERLRDISKRLKNLEAELVQASSQLQEEEGFYEDSLMIEGLTEVQESLCNAFESCDRSIEMYLDD